MKQATKVLVCSLVVLLSILFHSCRKDKDSLNNLYRNGWSEMDSISDRSFFPPNITTWIYEDSVSKELDTVVFVSIYIDTTKVYYSKYPEVLHYTKVQKSIALYDVGTDKTIYYSSLVGDPFVNNSGVIKKSTNRGSYTFAVTPLIYKGKFTTLHGAAGVFEFHAFYEVNGTSYMNVAEIEFPGEVGSNGNHTKYFFTPNVGTIKLINYNSNKVWQLVSVY